MSSNETAAKIRELAKKQNITLTELAARLNISRQNLNSKLNKKEFTEKDLKEIAAALDCTYYGYFKINSSGEIF